MSSPASVAGRERLRLFCALRLPAEAIEGIVAWQRGLSGGRIVPAESLHLTLAFLGHVEAGRVPGIVDALRRSAASAGPISLRCRRYRETRSVGMLVFDDEEGRATTLAEDLHRRLEALGVYEREQRPWLAHLTVLRFRERPRLDTAPPDLGAVVPSDVALYHSVLRSAGAQYGVLESVALGG